MTFSISLVLKYGFSLDKSSIVAEPFKHYNRTWRWCATSFSKQKVANNRVFCLQLFAILVNIGWKVPGEIPVIGLLQNIAEKKKSSFSFDVRSRTWTVSRIAWKKPTAGQQLLTFKLADQSTGKGTSLKACMLKITWHSTVEGLRGRGIFLLGGGLGKKGIWGKICLVLFNFPPPRLHV